MLRFLFFSLLFSLPALAQFDATVLGTVKDASGSVISNSKVTLSNLANGTQQGAVTGASGEYQFLNVRLGEYTLKAEAAGFKSASAEPFTVTVNAHQRVDLNLEIGRVTETVVVSGAAALLETDSSNRSQVINSREILNLPLNGRAYADLTLLVPGVRKSVLQNQSDSSREASYNINGQRAESNNFILDGIDNNAQGTSNQGFSNQVVQIAPDAVQEYRVETSNYSAEYGRASGGVINATTRSGTNTLHGTLWEYLRNTSLNAVGFFQPLGGVKPTYIQNQFGAAAGGALIKNKLFLFGDYEGLRRITRTLTYATVPFAEQRAGSVGVPVVNPYTGAVYADGVIPKSLVTPSAVTVLAALPLPNVNQVSNNFQSLPRGTITDDKGDFRMDFYASPKLTAFTRYSHRVDNIFSPPNIPGPAGGNSNGNVHIFNQQLDPGVTYSFSASSVLDARLGFTWTEGGKSPIGLGEPSLLTGVPNLPADPLVAGAMYSQSVTGFSQFGRQGSNPQFQNPFVIDPKVNYSKFMGHHTLKFGYEYLWIDTVVSDFNPAYGSESYNGLFSKPGTASGVTNLNPNNLPAGAVTEAYGITDYLFGARNNYQLNNVAVVNYKQFMHFLYAQDDWKVTDRLTLNLGLRYEVASPQWEQNNRLANFDPATQTLVQAKAGDLYDRSLQETQLNNFAPRFGFAWRPIDKTVVRGGYGISYQQFNRLGGENLLAYNGPNIISASIDQTPGQGLCGVDSKPTTCFRPISLGFPANFAVPANFNTLTAQARYIPKDNPTGYVESWHVSVQRELGRDLVLDLAYVGSHGVHLMVLADANQAVPNQPGQNLSLQARRPYPNFNFIEIAYGAGSSSYHAFQAKLEKRFSRGLYLLNSFTWSKTIDNAAGHLETYGGDNSRVNFANVANDRAVSSYDQPFNNTTSVVWDIPFGKGRMFGGNGPAIAQGALGGWQFSAINTATSGLPINLSYNPTQQFSVSSAPTYRPNISGDPVTPEGQRTTLNYLNRATVSVPTDPSHPWGNAGRNVARGYGFFQLDMGLHKQFPLWSETRKLEFRAEAFNLLNQTNFMAPDANISNSSFGSITTTFPARQLQFAAKVIF
jgi:hypothetical protein